MKGEGGVCLIMNYKIGDVVRIYKENTNECLFRFVSPGYGIVVNSNDDNIDIKVLLSPRGRFSFWFDDKATSLSFTVGNIVNNVRHDWITNISSNDKG